MGMIEAQKLENDLNENYGLLGWRVSLGASSLGAPSDNSEDEWWEIEASARVERALVRAYLVFPKDKCMAKGGAIVIASQMAGCFGNEIIFFGR